MATDLDASFNEQYLNINTKLKKRFMRKPNLLEATNEFIALAIQCENCEQPSFAGQAYVGAAKCENMAGNFLSEAEQYLSAARQYMKAEKKLSDLKFYSPERENLEASIGCYMLAMSKYPEKSPMRSSILLELASSLIALNHKNEALAYLEQVLPCIEGSARKILLLQKIINLQIDCGKYEEAIIMANMMHDKCENIPDNIFSELQVNRVLLSLLVALTEENKPESLKQLLTDLVNDCYSSSIPFNTDLRLKLQSIIMCHSTYDKQSLILVSTDMNMLTTQQKELLEALIKDKKFEE